MVIDIIDVNEFDPVFERKTYDFVISTSQIDQIVGSVKVPITTIYLEDMYLDNRWFCRLDMGKCIWFWQIGHRKLIVFFQL